MKYTSLALVILLAACSSDEQSEAPVEAPSEAAVEAETVDSSDGAVIFPAARNLAHAEDGVILADGRLIVGDNDHGLVILAEDGTKSPFGGFPDAGYYYDAADPQVTPNGVALEPDSRHILVADVTQGKIFRADSETGAVTLDYQHAYGVNTAVRDSKGVLWFTQSTENTTVARMWEAVNRPMGDGGVFRLAPGEESAAQVISGLDFANGIVVDEARGQFYVAETLGDKVHACSLDIPEGEMATCRVLAELALPDNLELDEKNTLWVVSPGGNFVMTINPDSGGKTMVYDPTPEAAAATVAEWNRRMASGEPLAPVLPTAGFPGMPGLLTGVILPPGDADYFYVSGLGDAMIRVQK